MRAGIPDIICCHNGQFIAIEVKDIGNSPSELQLAHGRQIIRAGGKFIVAYSVKDIQDKLGI